MAMFWHGLAWHLMEWNGWRMTKMVIARLLLPPRTPRSGSYFASPTLHCAALAVHGRQDA